MPAYRPRPTRSASAASIPTPASSPTHAGLLAQVDSAVDTFLTSVARSPHAQRLVVMIYSEFGRRVATNASGGTDHGTASPVILAGPGVRGGHVRRSAEPDAASAPGDDDGDLVVTTDFRDVYATVLATCSAPTQPPSLGTGRRSLGFVKPEASETASGLMRSS